MDFCKAFEAIARNCKSDEFGVYVISTNESTSVREFAQEAFRVAGYNQTNWVGQGLAEKLVSLNGQVLVEVNSEYFRPGEVPYLKGTSTKIKNEFGWSPQTSWKQIASEMVKYDLDNYIYAKL